MPAATNAAGSHRLSPALRLVLLRGQPYQEKPETAEYRVVHSPSVAVRDRPWGRVIGSKRTGELVKTTARSVGLSDGAWVQTVETFGPEAQHGWMLLDGAAISLGTLLERVESGRAGMVARYVVVVASTDVRERPTLAGTPVVGTRRQGELIRTDQELNGWVRLQQDFYQTGKAEPIEGWAMIHGAPIGQGPILRRWEAPGPTPALIGAAVALGGQTVRFWVTASEGTCVRERPWGRVLCRRQRGMLLRCDMVKDGWARLEADFSDDGPIDTLDTLDDEQPLLEGWVLLDGRDLGLPCQLQRYAGEKVPPPAEESRDAGGAARAPCAQAQGAR